MKYKIEAVGEMKSGTGKNGKPYYQIGLKIAGDGWRNGFVTDGWTPPKPGDELELELFENGQYKNFKLPTKAKQEIAGIEERLERIEKMVTKIGQHLMVLAYTQATLRMKPPQASYDGEEGGDNCVPDPEGFNDPF